MTLSPGTRLGTPVAATERRSAQGRLRSVPPLGQTFVGRVMVRANPQDLLEQLSRVFVVAMVPCPYRGAEQVGTPIRRQSPLPFGALRPLALCGLPLLTLSVAHRPVDPILVPEVAGFACVDW